MTQDRREEKWHVGKEIPVAVIFAFFMQSVGAVWWAATLSSKIDELSYQVAALTADKYTQHDAIKDQALTAQRISTLEKRIENVESITHGGVKWQR